LATLPGRSSPWFAPSAPIDSTFHDPLRARQVWIHFLDGVRYLFVWHPLILAFAHATVGILDPEFYVALRMFPSQISVAPTITPA
jgi:hypothetical protein